MKKLNLLVGILVIAALLLLIVLFIQTLFTDGNTDKPAVTPTPPKITATPTPKQSDNPADTPMPTEDVQTTPEISPLEGESLVIEAAIGREKLTVVYSAALFTRFTTEIGEQFFLKSDPSNESFIEIVFVEGNVELRKASFLDPYIPDFTDMDALGQVLIAGSSVAAEGMSATNGSKFAEAWLIDVEGGFFAVVAGYNDEESRSDLYRMLDSLTFSL